MSNYHRILSGDIHKDEWRLHLTYFGSNDANESGWSDKFWEVSHAAGSNLVTVRWGRCGTYGQSMTCPVSKGVRVAGEKLAKGYTETLNRCKHQTSGANNTLNIVAKAKTMAFPYNLTATVKTIADGIVLLDDDGDEITTLTTEGVRQLFAA